MRGRGFGVSRESRRSIGIGNVHLDESEPWALPRMLRSCLISMFARNRFVFLGACAVAGWRASVRLTACPRIKREVKNGLAVTEEGEKKSACFHWDREFDGWERSLIVGQVGV
jgi:hypothetical protein